MSEDKQKKAISVDIVRYLPCLLILAGIVAYANSFSGPFIYDDEHAILENPHIRTLWPLSEAMKSPPQSPVSARPIVSLTLALNYALSEYNVWSYHAFNLLVHLLAGLTLYGIVRRTLLTEPLKERFAKHASILAWAAATIWLVHPIQTDSITYVIQRTESLMGLFYLLTLYSAIRVIQGRRTYLWLSLSVLCCGLGMATKEVMVTAPVLVLLYDRTFVSGSFLSALRRRRALYLGLAATWVILFVLVISGPRTKSVGFSVGISSLEYAKNQAIMLVRYTKLVFWPHPLVLDYGQPFPVPFSQAAPYIVVVMALVIVTVMAFFIKPVLGFVGLWFFLILAPTSSFIPIITELGAGRRMYLPLASIVAVVVMTGYLLLEQIPKVLRKDSSDSFAQLLDKAKYKAGIFVIVMIIASLVAITIRRNHDFRSRVSIWQSSINALPENPRAYVNLGRVLESQGSLHDAIEHYQKALKLNPNFALAHYNLAWAFSQLDMTSLAVKHYRKAISLKPVFPEAHNNLATELASLGEIEEALKHYKEALKLAPDNALVHYNIASFQHSLGKAEKALWHFQRALEIKPDYLEAHSSLAKLFVAQGDLDRAIVHFRKALQAKPNDFIANYNLALTLKLKGDLKGALYHLRIALSVRPYHAGTHKNLAMIFRSQGKLDKAVYHYQQALSKEPKDFLLHYNLSILLARQKKIDKAIEHMKRVVEINPDFQEAKGQLDTLLRIRVEISQPVKSQESGLEESTD